MHEHIFVAIVAGLINLLLSVLVPCALKKTGMPFFPEVKKMLNQHHEMLITSSVLVGVIVFLALQAVPVVKDEMSEISSFLNNLNMNLMPPVDLKSGINK